MTGQHDDEFVDHRGYLLALGYRLTGSVVDAEDAVAEAWLRWEQHRGEVREPRAWLTRVVSRLCLDLLRSAHRRRETYVGPWLPEPVVSTVDGPPDPLEQVVVAEQVRLAFLIVLDQLSPEQRVAVVLHEVLDVPFAEVAEVLGCGEPAARQHASRGRRRLGAAPLPPPTPAPEATEVLSELAGALADGDAERVAGLLAPDVVLVSDGAGEVRAARNVLRGRDHVQRFLTGLATKYADVLAMTPAVVNGTAGIVVRLAPPPSAPDPLLSVYAFDVADGVVTAIHAVLAPDKLSHLPGSPYPRPPARTPPPS